VVTKAATEHPVLVLGTKGDPATPYANAAAMASSLGNAVELTWEGDGHTAFPKTKCVNDAVGSLPHRPRRAVCGHGLSRG
jgi:hypothetical protein